jgi:hypothetical protein
MGALTETEIFDCLATNFALAAEASDALAVLPLKGQSYDKLRKALRLVEGACKQACVWREDARWLPIGQQMAECHQRAGDWLRGIKMPDGTRRRLASGELHPCFHKLAEVLRAMAKMAQELKTRATKRSGMILPQPLPGPHRDTRPVGYRRVATGLLIPQGATLQ